MIKILVFGSKTCKPCGGWKRMLGDAGIKFEYYDVEKNPELANKYMVMSLPTTIVLKNGIPIASVIGAGKTKLQELKEAMR